ncbi:hypothetical protein TNCV_2466591 [Trichonephila clavipes]|nr:hypothetical protein TNCV_2466591 [Trichonephila clavipes]
MTIAHVQAEAYLHTPSLLIQSKDDSSSSWIIGGAYISVGLSGVTENIRAYLQSHVSDPTLNATESYVLASVKFWAP